MLARRTTVSFLDRKHPFFGKRYECRREEEREGSRRPPPRDSRELTRRKRRAVSCSRREIEKTTFARGKRKGGGEEGSNDPIELFDDALFGCKSPRSFDTDGTAAAPLTRGKLFRRRETKELELRWRRGKIAGRRLRRSA